MISKQYTLVIAGNYEQFRSWLQDSGRNPRYVRYATEGRDILGWTTNALREIVLTGEYWLSPLWQNTSARFHLEFLRNLMAEERRTRHFVDDVGTIPAEWPAKTL